jgi:Tetratricopeptide repeat
VTGRCTHKEIWPRPRTLQEQVLEARARLGGKEPDTLTPMLNLASLYYSQNKYAKAESLHRQVPANSC